MSSADWMERNLDMRVETCFPVEGKKLIDRVKKELDLYIRDNTYSWILQTDGSYIRAVPQEGQEPISAQQILFEQFTNPTTSR